jgi:insertion element IS1 protein InsB
VENALLVRQDAVFLQLQTLLEPFGITRFYAEGWGAYERHIAPEQHAIGLTSALR